MIFTKEKFDDLSKLYIAQVIDNSRKKEVPCNWYNDFVGELFIVRLRETHERVGYPRPVIELQYCVAKLTPTQNFYSINKLNTSCDFIGYGFNNADIKLISEYIIPVPPKPEVPYVTKEGVKIYKADAEGIINWLKTLKLI